MPHNKRKKHQELMPSTSAAAILCSSDFSRAQPLDDRHPPRRKPTSARTRKRFPSPRIKTRLQSPQSALSTSWCIVHPRQFRWRVTAVAPAHPPECHASPVPDKPRLRQSFTHCCHRKPVPIYRGCLLPGPGTLLLSLGLPLLGQAGVVFRRRWKVPDSILPTRK